MADQNLTDELAKYIENLVNQSETYRKLNDPEFRDKVISAASSLLNASFKLDLQPVLGKLNTEVGMDLIDRKLKVGAIVLWTSDAGMIRTCLKKFWKSKYVKSIDTFLVYIIANKGKILATTFPEKKIKGNHPLFFDADRDIFDSKMLLKILVNKPAHILSEVVSQLKQKFSEKMIGPNFSEGDLTRFLKEYKERYANTISKINFLGLALAKVPDAVSLSEFYIRPHYYTNIWNPSISDFRSENAYERVKRPLIETFRENKHLLLLGAPGAGKSLISKYVTHGLLSGNPDFLQTTIEDHIPFRIELRNYLKLRQGRIKESFLHFIASLLDEFSVEIGEDDLFHIFLKQKTIVFCDGLDEIFSADDRRKLLFEIENFSIKFPKTRMVLTSRAESFKEINATPLNIRLYLHTLMSFEQDEMEEFIQKWFDLQKDEKYDKVYRNAFLSKIEHIDEELKFSPLLLSLILLVYKNNGETIPTTRFEIFKACTETLVTYRDEKRKGISMADKIQGLTVKPEILFSSLACWQFEKLTANEMVTYKGVHDFLMDLFTQTSPEIASEGMVKDFLDYAKLRSIYVDNQFTHQTFLEYYTASQIYRNYQQKTSDKNYLKNVLQRYAAEPGWKVVLELLMSNLEFENDLNLEIIINDAIEDGTLDSIILFLSISGTLTSIDDGIIYGLLEQCLKLAIEGSQRAFDQLLDAKEDSILSPLLEKALQRQLNNLEAEPAAVCLFEFAQISQDIKLLKKLKTIPTLSDYHFILQNLEKLQDRDEYMSFIVNLSQNTNTEELLKSTYVSRYRKNLFSGKPQLNLITNFIFIRDIDDWEEIYEDLLNHGISEEIVLLSVQQPMFLNSSNKASVARRLETVTNAGFAQVLDKVLAGLNNPSISEE